MKQMRKHSTEFKRQIIEDIESGLMTVAQASREHNLASSMIYNWRRKWERGELDNEPTPKGANEVRIAMLERKIGQQALEIELLKKAKKLYDQRIREGSYRAPLSGPYKGGAVS